MVTNRALSRSRCQRPRSTISPGTASTSAASVIRAVTAAPGDQPVTSSPLAIVPDIPNDIAVRTAKAKPARVERAAVTTGVS